MESRVGGPLDILKLLIGSQVSIELKDGSQINGLLKAYDEHLNTILYTSSSGGNNSDILFIRGDLVVIIKEL